LNKKGERKSFSFFIYKLQTRLSQLPTIIPKTRQFESELINGLQRKS